MNIVEIVVKGADEKSNFDGWIIYTLGDTRHVFRSLKYNNEEISHSKCPFSHPGNCTLTPHLQRCVVNRILMQLAGSEKMLKMLQQILKEVASIP